MNKLFTWIVYNLVGYFYAAIILTVMVVKAIFKPTAVLRQRNWEDVEFADPAPDLQHEFYDVGRGITIHAARTGGSPQKPILLCVHGYPEYWGSWRHQIQAFRDQYDVVAIDMRGYGRSSKPDDVDSYQLDKLVLDIVGVIKALCVEKVVLCGHDWGGNVCWGVAATHPELIDKLIIACCPHPRNFKIDFLQFFRSWYMFFFLVPYVPEALYRYDNYGILDTTFKDGMSRCLRPDAMTRADVERYKKEAARPGSVSAQLNYYRALMRTLTIKPLRQFMRTLKTKVAMPVLLIWASDDIALGQQLIPGVEKYADDLKVHVIQNCSHWAQQDRPEEFNSVVQEFLLSK